MPGVGTDASARLRPAEIGAVPPSVGQPGERRHPTPKSVNAFSEAEFVVGPGRGAGRDGSHLVAVTVSSFCGGGTRIQGPLGDPLSRRPSLSETLSSGPEPTTSSGPTQRMTTPPAREDSTVRSLRESEGEPIHLRESPTRKPYSCTYVADPQGQALLGAGGPKPGEWIILTCAGPGAIDPLPPFWVAGAKPAAVTVQVAPVVEMAPPDGHPQLVNVATWLWVSPAGWHPLTATASADPETTTATATPTKVVWDMADGSAVTCDGPGPPSTRRLLLRRRPAFTPGRRQAPAP